MSTTTSEYVGAFVAGLPCGAGKVTHADGSTYEGTFVGGQVSALFASFVACVSLTASQVLGHWPFCGCSGFELRG